MLPYTQKEIANKLGELYKSAIDSVLVPIITNSGIIVGAYMVKPNNGLFLVTRKGKVYHTTFSKSAALIIAGLMNKKKTTGDIHEVLEADRITNALRNDLMIFKYHRDAAIKRNDHTKEQIMLARFEVTTDRYNDAKAVLKKTYSKLF